MCSSGFFASSEKDTRLDKVPGVVVASESVVGASDTLCSSSQGVRPGMPSALAARLTARRADLLRSLRGRAQLKLSHAFHVVAIARSPAPKAIFLSPGFDWYKEGKCSRRSRGDDGQMAKAIMLLGIGSSARPRSNADTPSDRGQHGRC